jgi:hypothetical protein
MNSPRGTSLQYYGFPLAGLFIVIAILLLGSSSAIVNLAVVAIGGFVTTEGVALVCNWHGGADEFARRLQENPNSVLGSFSPPIVRAILGVGMIIFGVIALWGGIRYL